MKRYWKGLALLAVMAVAFLGLADIGAAADTVKLGVVGPRTGGAAATGKAFEEGIAPGAG